MDTDSQVMNTCRKIVILTYRSGMKNGEKLPSQGELVKLTGSCNITLSPAIKLLEQCGFLECKNKSGRILLNQEAWPEELFRIGIPYGLPSNTPGAIFSSTVLALLLNSLQKKRCLCVPFCKERERIHKLDDFYQLQRYYNEQRLDGIITYAYFQKNVIQKLKQEKFPFYHIGSCPSMISGTSLHHESIITRALNRFHESGVHRPVLMQVIDHDPSTIRLEQLFRKTASDYGMTVSETSCLRDNLSSPGLHTEYLKTSDKYDGLLILNDYLGSFYSARIGVTGIRPVFAVQTNSEIPLVYAMEPIRYEYDCKGIVNVSTDGLMKLMLFGKKTVRIEVEAKEIINK